MTSLFVVVGLIGLISVAVYFAGRQIFVPSRWREDRIRESLAEAVVFTSHAVNTLDKSGAVVPWDRIGVRTISVAVSVTSAGIQFWTGIRRPHVLTSVDSDEVIAVGNSSTSEADVVKFERVDSRVLLISVLPDGASGYGPLHGSDIEPLIERIRATLWQ